MNYSDPRFIPTGEEYCQLLDALGEFGFLMCQNPNISHESEVYGLMRDWDDHEMVAFWRGWDEAEDNENNENEPDDARWDN